MNPTSIRLPETIERRILAASEGSGLSKNDIIKLALQAGLTWMERNNYDMTQPLTDESRTALLAEIIGQLQALLDAATDRIVNFHPAPAASQEPAFFADTPAPRAAEDPIPYRASAPPAPPSTR